MAGMIGMTEMIEMGDMGDTLHLLLCITAGIILVFISLQDIRTGSISDRKNLLLLGVGIADSICITEPGIAWRLAGLFCVSSFFFISSLLTEGGIGGGDVKLTAAAGFFLGLKKMIAAAAAGMILAGIFSMVFLCTGKKTGKDSFALGPFLCIGILIGMLH